MPFVWATVRAGSVPVVGVLHQNLGPASVSVESLRRGLREIGYIEGQTVALEVRFAGGKLEAFPALADDLVRRNIDVLAARLGCGVIVAPFAAAMTFGGLRQSRSCITRAALGSGPGRPA